MATQTMYVQNETGFHIQTKIGGSIDAMVKHYLWEQNLTYMGQPVKNNSVPLGFFPCDAAEIIESVHRQCFNPEYFIEHGFCVKAEIKDENIVFNRLNHYDGEHFFRLLVDTIPMDGKAAIPTNKLPYICSTTLGVYLSMYNNNTGIFEYRSLNNENFHLRRHTVYSPTLKCEVIVIEKHRKY